MAFSAHITPWLRRGIIGILPLLCAAGQAAWAATLRPEVSLLPDGSLAVSVNIQPGSSETVAGLQFDLELPGGAYTVLEVLPGSAAQHAGKEVVHALHGDALTVLVAGFNQSSIGEGAVATIYLASAAPDDGGAGLGLSRAVLSDPEGNAVAMTLLPLEKSTAPAASANGPSAESGENRQALVSPVSAGAKRSGIERRYAAPDPAEVGAARAHDGNGGGEGGAIPYVGTGASALSVASSPRRSSGPLRESGATPLAPGAAGDVPEEGGTRLSPGAGPDAGAGPFAAKDAALAKSAASPERLAARGFAAGAPRPESAAGSTTAQPPRAPKPSWRDPVIFVALLCGIFLARAVQRRLFRKG
ncbi:MAG: hypothetical protein KA184_18450 [Candidatus Hydrogenedentes bacterium]|nr:hypothetical protein [Candidatus Hydrogenedentota bacterium]